MSRTDQIAEDIVDAILSNLKGRKGVGDQLNALDSDVYDGLVQSLEAVTEGVLRDYQTEDTDAHDLSIGPRS